MTPTPFEQQNGRGTILEIARNNDRDLSGTIQPLAGPGQPFPTSRGFCGVIITDERNAGYDAFPDPGNDALISELSLTNSAVFIIGLPGDQDYQELADATGGTLTSVDEFLANPGPTIQNIVERCVERLCSTSLVVR